MQFKTVLGHKIVVAGKFSSNKDALETAIAKNINLSRIDLRDMDLRNINFCGANLQHANLQYADLRGAILAGSDLSNSVLSGADFTGANLQYTMFKCANTSKSIFEATNLSNACFSQALACNTNFRNALLTGATFGGAYLNGADFTEADVGGVDFHFARNMKNINFNNANIIGMKHQCFGASTVSADGALIAQDVKLTGKLCMFFINNIGPHPLIGYKTEKGMFFRSGDFFGQQVDLMTFVKDSPDAELFSHAIEVLKLILK